MSLFVTLLIVCIKKNNLQITTTLVRPIEVVSISHRLPAKFLEEYIHFFCTPKTVPKYNQEVSRCLKTFCMCNIHSRV